MAAFAGPHGLDTCQGSSSGTQRRAFAAFESVEWHADNRGQNFEHKAAASNAARNADAFNHLAVVAMGSNAKGYQICQGFEGGPEANTRVCRLCWQPSEVGFVNPKAGLRMHKRQHSHTVAAGRYCPGKPLEFVPVWFFTHDAVEELRAVGVAAHPQERPPVEAHTVEAVGCGRRGSTAVHHCRIAEDDSHLPGFDCPAAGKAGLLIVGGGEDQRCP